MAKYKITSYWDVFMETRKWQAWSPQGALIETCPSWEQAAWYAKWHHHWIKKQGYGGYYSG